ncbi:hypothetical protein [Streptomyces sp. GS7]|uniref:hypothetical protein n=1 Tax=Streptomyces sp. GS7 TaxID=2692234 RepID=UPI001318EC4F|nr:hypothetical protein [Streptomyces sp. GS7]QHC23483.1 hypothetical protein GR130_20970 [Streptomyces sp. GS7]
MPTTWRIATAATLSALLVAGLSACGGSQGGGSSDGGSSGGGSTAPEKKAADLDPKGALEAAATAMAQAGSASMATSSVAPPAGGSSGSSSGQGGSGSYTWKSPEAFQMSMNNGSRAEITLYVDGTMYFGGDKITKNGSGKKWLKCDSTTYPTMKKTDLSVPSPAAMTEMREFYNPVAQLTANAKAGRLTKAGNETVGGTKTVHIQSFIKTDVWAAALPGVAAQQKEVAGAMHQQSATYDFWIDEQNRLVQVRMSDPGLPYKPGIQTTYSAYGTAPKISTPPANEVPGAAQLSKNLQH